MAWGPGYFVVVDDDGWRSYWDAGFGEYHFGRLLGGPDLFRAYLDRHTYADPGFEPLDDLLDGGAVVDLTTRHLRWFSVANDAWSTASAYRRGYWRLLAELWPGWRIDWAYRGAEELVDHVRVHRSAVRRTQRIWRSREVRAADAAEVWFEDRAPPANAQAFYDLVTVRGADGTTRAWALDAGHRAAHPAWLGTQLLERLPGPGRTPARAAIPVAGLHLDTVQRRLGLWTTLWVADLFAELPALWSGWRVEFWEDRFADHAEATDGAVELPACDVGSLVRGAAGTGGVRLFDMPPLDDSGIDPSIAVPARGRLDAAIARLRIEYGAA